MSAAGKRVGRSPPAKPLPPDHTQGVQPVTQPTNHRPTRKQLAAWAADYGTPSDETLIAWLSDQEDTEALDGCAVEPDGTCPHGAPSWLRYLALI